MSKLNTLLANNADLLLLSETKLSDFNMSCKIKNVLALCKNGPYEFISSSGTSARGVAIIIKKNLLTRILLPIHVPTLMHWLSNLINMTSCSK